MITIECAAEMQKTALVARRAGTRIGFVPTMGYLHEGHISLVHHARKLCDMLVVSIFVNPIQFGPGEDLARYPREFARDAGMCLAAGVDIIFNPSPAGMYAQDHSTYVEEISLSSGLCGATRPGHFRGVATVVAKLFNIVQPDIAVFGAKDAQQAAVIGRMARDLSFPVEIVIAPTIRETGGLAMSSRNKYLSGEDRKKACCLHSALSLAERMAAEGQVSTSEIERAMKAAMEALPGVIVEYIEVVDSSTLKRVERITGTTLVAVAVKIGATRLIDNVVINPPVAGC